MKRTIQILLLCLLATTVLAQSNTRRLHITTIPKGMFLIDLKVYPTAELNNYSNFRGEPIITMTSDTTGIDVQVPVGAGIYMSIGFNGYNRPNINNYVLESWKDNGETVALRQNGFSFLWVMPDHDADLVGTFVYDPGVPGQGEQPMMGGWDPETGTLINDAESGTPSGVSGVDRSKVLRYIRVGNYWGSSNKRLYFDPSSYPNCSFFDASRTNAQRVSCSYSSSNTCSLTDVVLPATVTSFSRNDFDGVPLQTLTLYALTPPAISSYDWLDIIVRVPAEVVPIYKAHEQWGRFNIVPIEGDYVNLSVQLMATPDSATIAQYKNMYLDLINIESGTTRTMLVNSRNVYEFRYLPTNTAYHAVLRTATGSEIARIGNIYLGKDNKTVTFGPLKTPRKMMFSLLGSDNQTVDEALYTTTWFKADGTYLKRGNTIDNVLDGQKLLIMPLIGPELAMLYAQPDTVRYTVGEDDDYHLQLILPVQPVTTATFTAVDSLTHLPISGVTIDVAQVLLNGDLGTRSQLTTDDKGRATGQVLATMSVITMTSPQHGSQTFTANLADSTTFRKAFLEARGTTLQLSHTWQAAVDEGETPVVEPFYSDGHSLEYTFTATLPDGRDSVMVDYLRNYPNYTFYNTLPKGTKVRVAAESPTGNIDPVEATTVVANEPSVSVTLPIVERGTLHVNYKSSQSIHPAALLFNATTGELVTKQSFGDRMFLNFANLPSGEYLVAAMSKGPQFLSIGSRNQLEMYVKDKDYVATQLTIGQGRNTSTEFASVPIVKTQMESNLSERYARSSVDGKVGYQVCIAVKMAFKDLKERYYGSTYDESLYPTDCQLEVYLPEGIEGPTASCSYRTYYYVDFDTYRPERVSYQSKDELKGRKSINLGSIAQHVTASVWNVQERKLTIPWPHYDEGGKMNITALATKAGSFMPEIYVSYTLNGKQYREVIEATSLVVSRSTIDVNDVVVTPRVVVVGKASYIEPDDAASERKKSAKPCVGSKINSEPTHYEVTVMDGDTPIGQAKIKKDGTWTAYCYLKNPTTNSKHNIYAVIKPTRNSFSYQTESKTVIYDPNAVVPCTTTMTFFNHHPQHLESQKVVFDYINMKATPESYGYSNEEGYNTDFTFEVNLSNNDTTKVYACALHIWTEGPDGGEVISWAHYNKRKNRWIAYEKFNTQAIPNSVLVEPFYYYDVLGSRERIDQSYSCYEALGKQNAEIEALRDQMQKIIEQGNAAYERGEPVPFDELRAIDRQLNQLLGISEYSDPATPPVSQEEVEAMIEELNKDLFNIEDLVSQAQKPFNELGKVNECMTIEKADGMTASTLEANGYTKTTLDDGTATYVLFGDDGSVTIVDLERSVKIIMTAKTAALIKGIEKGPSPLDPLAEFDGLLLEFQSKLEAVKRGIDDIDRKANEILIKEKEAYEAICRLLDKYALEKNWLESSLVELDKWFVAKKMETVKNVIDGINGIKATALYNGMMAGWGLISDLWEFSSNQKELGKVIVAIQVNAYYRCNDTETRLKMINLAREAERYSYQMIYKQKEYLSADIAALGLAAIEAHAVLTGAGTLPGVVGLIATLGGLYVSIEHSCVYAHEYNVMYNKYQNELDQLRKMCKKIDDCVIRGACPKCVTDGSCPDWPKKKHGPYYPYSPGTLDPSGFVYEGIESNRLEGVTTTVFFKETTKDLFGDDVERVTMWDAERYNQVNPQLTDEKGEYGWMVPSGQWQVKYEKDGYLTEYSEWLPVPPPQLDVNQNMLSMSQPVVSDVKATPKAVQVTFDKPMRADSITTASILVTRNGQKVSGTLDLMLSDDADPLLHLTNRVSFVPNTPLPAGQKLMLTVKGDVVSYAGVEMGSDFQQEFDIKAAVERIVADSAVNVRYDEGYLLTLQAMPAEAAAGKKVIARMLGDMIATINATELTLDAQGKAQIIITGEAHGTTGLVLQMADDADVKQVVVVTVREDADFVCPMPVSNYQPSQAYLAGTQIELSCELPEATIWYTLDGSCPCNSDNDVYKYEGPITLTDDMLIKAFATAPGWVDSDITEFTFLLLDPSGIREINDRQPAKAKGTYTLFGVKVTDTKHLQPGIYIKNGRKIVVK